MAFNLTNKEVNYWENRLRNAYSVFKGKVVDSFNGDSEITFNDVKETYMQIIEKKIKEELAAIDDKNWSGYHICFNAPYRSDFGWIDSVSKCEKIREICTPLANRRDKYVQILVSKPTEEEFRELCAFVKELDNLEIPKQELGELKYYG